MTHYPNIPVVWLLATAGIFLAITGLPTAAVVGRLWGKRRLRKIGAAALAGTWLVAYPNTVWRWHRHGQLEREVYRQAGCLGYGHGAIMPDHCREAIAQANIVPDGFFFWSAVSLGLAVACMAVVFAAPVLEERGWTLNTSPS